MIKLKKIPDNIISAHLSYFKSEFLSKLEAQKNKKQARNKYKEFLNFLYENYEDILIGEPEKLHEIRENIERNHNEIYETLKINIKLASTTQKKYKERVSKIFDYESFTRIKIHKWDAYKLTEALNINICPYCNRSFTTTHKDNEGQTRPTLDHFYDKARYPYFALSIYNLVPCCYICNSSFKGSEDFCINNYLHPYIDGFDGNANYSLMVKDHDMRNLFKGEFKIKLNISDSTKYASQIKNNEKIFHLTELYGYHYDYINELINQKIIYTDKNIEQLSSLPIFENEDEIRLLLIGQKGNININADNKLLSKLIKDISLELGL